MGDNELLYSIDVSGSINKYATIFNINYESKFEENHIYLNASKKRKIKIISVNNKEIRIARDNAEVYYLECLEKLNLEIFGIVVFYNGEKDEIELDYKYFMDICCDIQRCFKGTLNYCGKSFTDDSLIPGDFDLYYFQYMAFKMFGTSLAIYGFNNLSEIKEKIKNVPKQFMSQLVEKKFLENLKKNMGEDNKVFKKGDILEFTIFMKDPKLKLLSDSENMTKEYNNSEKKYKIGNSFWNIYFIIL